MYWSCSIVFIFLLTIIVTSALYRVSWSSALLMASAGYAAQNIAGNIKGILRLTMSCGNFWNSLPHEVLLDCVCYIGSYMLLYLIFADAIRSNQGDYDSEIKAWFALAVIVLRILTYSMPEEIGTRSSAALIGDNLRSISIRFLLLMVQFGTLQNHQLNRDVDTMRELIHTQRAQFETSRECSQIIEEKYHDLKKMIHSLSGQLPAEQLGRLEDSIADYGAAVHTGNEVLDILLTQKRMLCNREGIHITCIAEGVDLSAVEELDQYALFSNALTNAIEAVEKLSEEEPRYITLTLKQEQNMVFFHMENPCKGNVQYEDGLPRTTQDRDYHGFGMKSMERIAEKYGGSMCTSQQEGIFFLDMILLC